jgi:hypothetical protein
MQKRWNDIIIRLGKNSGGLKKKKEKRKKNCQEIELYKHSILTPHSIYNLCKKKLLLLRK